MFFSVVMPYYKNRKVVERSIQSVLRQTYPGFELVIVDDGSNDDIESYIQSIHDDRIKLISQKNQGVSVARNVAIKNSVGEWICFLDSDDEWMPHHLEFLHKMHTEYPESSFLLTSHKRVGNSIEISSKDLPNPDSTPFLINDLLDYLRYHPGVIHTNSVCLKKELVVKCGLFAEKVSRGEDTDLWYRCALYTPVVLTKEVTTIYYRENSFLTKNKEFNYDWIFLKRAELLADDEIPLEKKKTLQLTWQSYQLSICKHYLSDGNRKQCGCLLKEVKKNLIADLKKEYGLIKLLYILPGASFVLHCYFKRKQKKY